jgi:Kinesin motor domain
LIDLYFAPHSNRTKANIQQQKEANIINTSLMQLWRCLQSMQRKSSECNSEKSIDIIPFRDSKLTHLLMPQLCRAGLSGVAMIACVNPQIDDYDETLSILGELTASYSHNSQQYDS